MKRVYKCDYCYKFNEDIFVITEHEKKCSNNPENKTCRLCEHYVDEGMPISGSMYVCKKGKSYDEVDIFEDEGGCDLWEEQFKK